MVIIHVKKPDGSSLVLEASVDESIEAVKLRIAQTEGMPAGQQRLLFEHTEPANDTLIAKIGNDAVNPVQLELFMMVC